VAGKEATMKRMILLTVFVAACSTMDRAAAPAAVAAVAAAPANVAELAAGRARMIQWLHAYAQAGRYPADASGMPLSVFRDARGVRCPMAELIHRSGRDDLVDAVARQANGLRLADVHDGPLYDWMMHSGLTRDEIAMVQGAMRVDVQLLPQEYGNGDLRIAAADRRSLRIATANGVVRGHLETAEVALRDGTAHSLTVAAARLPAARSHAAGPVVPKAAIHAAPAVARDR
jgi:hypothetical protein